MTARKEINEDYDEVFISLDEPIFTTGVVCRLIDIPVWILKQLDREQIVSPPRKTEGKARLYSKRELKLVKHCWYYMKTRKVNVNGLKVILEIEEGRFEMP